MRLVGAAGAERARDQRFPIDVAGPRLGERARQREQHRPARQRPPRGAGAQAATAGVDHQRARGQQRFDLVEAQRLLAAGVEAPGGGTIERGARLRHLGQERRHARALGRLVRAGERRPRRRRCAASAAPARPRPARPPPPATAAGRAHRGAPARPRPRRGGRAAAAGAPRSAAPAARWRDRRAPRAWPTPPPACAASRRGRAWPAPPRPRRRRSGRAPAPRGRRSRGRRAAAARGRAGARRAGPWRCRAAPAPAGRRAGATRLRAPSASPAARARAAAAIRESMATGYTAQVRSDADGYSLQSGHGRSDAVDGSDDSGDMGRRRTAAATDEAHTCRHQLRHGAAEVLRSGRVMGGSVGSHLGEAGIAFDPQRQVRSTLRQFPCHLDVGVDADTTVGANEACAAFLCGLACLGRSDTHHGAVLFLARVEGETYADRQVAGAQAGSERRLCFLDIGHGLDHDGVGATFGQGRRLLGECGLGICNGQLFH